MKLVEKLQAVADGLPIVLEKVKKAISPAVAKQHYKNVKPGQVYYIEVERPVDHLKRLKDVYGKGGDNAVEAYVKDQYRIAAEQKQELKERGKKMQGIQTL